MLYKRNQIEEALSRHFGESTAEPGIELLTRVKRLLDTDRTLGRNKQSTNSELANYAFYSDDSPGKGVEVEFSGYEAFALLIGLQLLQHGWPQSFVVGVLRRLRPELEQQHARILRQDPAKLFDEHRLRRNARRGILHFGSTDPVILTIVSRHPSLGGSKTPLASGVFRGIEDLASFLRKQKAEAYTLHDIVKSVHTLAEHLSKVPARKRGRTG
jgi:hypothetical protein